MNKGKSMNLKLNVETLEVLLADRSAEVHGGTGLRCVRYGLKGTPLGQSSDLCCGSASCPKPPPAKAQAPAPKKGPITDEFKFNPPAKKS
jgi:hypothetical protein